MNLELLTFEEIRKLLLNTIFVSIPEEAFLVLFTLILTGEFSYWLEAECKKIFNSWDYPRILFPTILSALFSNLLRYSGINSYVVTIITFFCLFILIVITNDIIHDGNIGKWILKSLSSLLIGFFIIFITEILYLPFVLSTSSLTIGDINNDILLNFLVSLPSRVVQIMIIAYLIIKNRVIIKSNIFMYIYKKKLLTAQALLVTILNFFLLIISNKLLVSHGALFDVSNTLKLLFIVISCTIPLITTFVLIINPYYTENKQIIIQQEVATKLYKLKNEILSYSYEEKRKDIHWMLNKVSLDIEEIAEKLSDN